MRTANVIETHEHKGDFQKLIVALTFFSGASTVTFGMPESVPLPSVLVELLAQPTAESTISRSSTTLILTRGILLRSRGALQPRRRRGESRKLRL
jgi:hypothetical protein